MDDTRAKRINFLQNLTIALLTLSTVVLFAQTQFYNLGRNLSEPLSLLDSTLSGSTTAVTQLPTLSAPLRVVVSDTYGRYGSLTMTTTQEDFSPLDSLLKTALGSAGSCIPCSSEAYQDALVSTSVSYDFLAPLPLSVIASFSGITMEENLVVRTLLISAAGSADVTLYLWDGDSNYYLADTVATRNDLTETVNRYELGSADLAMDLAEENAFCAAIHPYSLLPRQQLQLPELSAALPSQLADRLLLALGFNPNTKYRSTDADGSELIVENERSLRVQPNGIVHYLSGNSSTLTIDAETAVPSLQEAAAQGSAFLADVAASLAGDAVFYLKEIQQNQEHTILRFGYQIDGVPLYFSNGSYAAEITLSGTSVISLDLHIRQYSLTPASTSLLPLQQALAIAAKQDGAELSIGYADNGTSTVHAAWMTT